MILFGVFLSQMIQLRRDLKHFHRSIFLKIRMWEQKIIICSLQSRYSTSYWTNPDKCTLKYKITVQVFFFHQKKKKQYSFFRFGLKNSLDICRSLLNSYPLNEVGIWTWCCLLKLDSIIIVSKASLSYTTGVKFFKHLCLF